MKRFLKLIERLLFLCVAAAIILSIKVSPLTRGEQAVLNAMEELGKKYVFNTEGPDTFDCSGLIMWSYAPLGLEIPHSAQEIGYDESVETIDATWKMLPGDLIFFDTVRDKDACDHVGIWLGFNRFIHASSSKKVVMISEFDEGWQEKFSWGKRYAFPLYDLSELLNALGIANK